jgi:hypothetical protein
MEKVTIYKYWTWNDWKVNATKQNKKKRVSKTGQQKKAWKLEHDRARQNRQNVRDRKTWPEQDNKNRIALMDRAVTIGQKSYETPAEHDSLISTGLDYPSLSLSLPLSF